MLKRFLSELIGFLKYLNNEIESSNVSYKKNTQFQSHYRH